MPLLPRSEFGNQPSQFHKIVSAKGCPACGNRHEWVRRHDIRPRCGKPIRLAVVVDEVDAAFPPVVLIIHKLEFAAKERMKRMDHAESPGRQIVIARS